MNKILVSSAPVNITKQQNKFRNHLQLPVLINHLPIQPLHWLDFLIIFWEKVIRPNMNYYLSRSWKRKGKALLGEFLPYSTSYTNMGASCGMFGWRIACHALNPPFSWFVTPLIHTDFFIFILLLLLLKTRNRK